LNLHPFDEVAANAESKMREGWEIHQQFNCEHCGAKQTIDEKNQFFTRGRCEECGKETDIRKNGCNFMAISWGHP
jgi:transcription elongation factor Elf1